MPVIIPHRSPRYQPLQNLCMPLRASEGGVRGDCKLYIYYTVTYCTYTSHYTTQAVPDTNHYTTMYLCMPPSSSEGGVREDCKLYIHYTVTYCTYTSHYTTQGSPRYQPLHRHVPLYASEGFRGRSKRGL